MSPAKYRQERKRRGLTQAALAALMGVPQETVSRRENGKQRITKEAARALQSLPANAALMHGKTTNDKQND